ncbi:uncharacterized protein LOC127126039 [Lathyrus oleraceus]|uniref:uncharacterized protein LOC127126039 n=1 Tax=Pisum sativum TaxID=3888 RepID=UPI0021D3C182|nr:uncharacterized protein LOC127126039 [Pisum sativum]
MDQVQAEMAEMRANMAQFLTMMQGVAQGQEELRALVQRQETVIQASNHGSPIAPPGFENANVAAAPVYGYATGEELRGIRVDGQPLAAEVNARATRAPARHPAPFVDRQEDMFTMMGEDEGDVARNEDRDRKVDALAEKIRAMECQNSLGFDVANMGLVEGLRIPHKFKAPTFDKYNGTSCPRTHVQAYYRKISAYTDDEKMWMYFFQDSLSGASLDWYMELKRDSIRCWRDLGEAFLRQYKHNMDMAPSRTQLQSLCQKNNESFKEYAQRWRELAARVQPPMLERELTDMFIGTLQGVFMDRMGSCPFGSFSDVVICGERTESLIKAGKINDVGSSSSKKPFSGAPRRREGETSAVQHRRGPNRNQHQYRQVAAVTIPAPQQRQPPQQPRQQQQQQQRPYQPRQRLQPDRRFDPLPMSYAELLPELLRLGFVELRTMAPPTVLPPGYDANVRCDFHSGAPGHNIEKCRAFQHKVQDLIDSKTINFSPVPNVVNNPMPAHGTHRVNCIEGVESEDLVANVEEIQTSLLVVKDRLLKGDVHPGCDENCLGCAESANGCDLLRAGIQGLMDQGRVQFGRADNKDRGAVSTVTIFFKPSEGRAPTTSGTPVTISAPVATNTPATIVAPVRRAENNNAVPWRYDNAYRSNRRAENRVKPSNQAPVTIFAPASKAPVVVSPAVDNVGGPGGFTRSGRLFAPQQLRDANAEASAKAKGKQAVVDEVPAQANVPGGSFEKDVEEFMRIIKKSDYKIVDQLNQTPSKISILSLLLCSEAHRDALLKMLNMAYVPQEISVNQLEGVIANVTTRHGVGFTDLDLTPEGRNHNKALHITMECKGVVLSHVLVDTGSSLNVLPKQILKKIPVEGVVLTPSDLVVRAFDGSKRSVFGEITLPIRIGPEEFDIVFYVMDIQPAYSCLLGRPWIHAAGAVSSTLHQKLKYVWNGQIVTVCGEEDILVSHLSSFKYVEVDGEIHETLCQAFETVAIEKVAYAEQKKPGASITSYKQAKEVVDSGKAEGWGKMVDLPVKEDKFGIGYEPLRAEQGAAGPSTFTSAGLMNHGDVFATEGEDVDSDCDLDCWVRPSAPGEVINNWTAEDIVQVTLQTE